MAVVKQRWQVQCLSEITCSADRFELALRWDVLLIRTDSDALQGLAGAQCAISRVRLLLECSGSLPVRGGMLRPTVEAGLGYDDDDAETGVGIEFGSGLGDATRPPSVEVNARGLLVHEDAGYEELEVQRFGHLHPGQGRASPLDEARLGLGSHAKRCGVAVGPAGHLGLARTAAFEAAQRFQGELGYGIAGRRKAAMWVPFIAAEAGQSGNRSLRMGVKLGSGPNIEAGIGVRSA